MAWQQKPVALTKQELALLLKVGVPKEVLEAQSKYRYIGPSFLNLEIEIEIVVCPCMGCATQSPRAGLLGPDDAVGRGSQSLGPRCMQFLSRPSEDLKVLDIFSGKRAISRVWSQALTQFPCCMVPPEVKKTTRRRSSLRD